MKKIEGESSTSYQLVRFVSFATEAEPNLAMEHCNFEDFEDTGA